MLFLVPLISPVTRGSKDPGQYLEESFYILAAIVNVSGNPYSAEFSPNENIVLDQAVLYSLGVIGLKAGIAGSPRPVQWADHFCPHRLKSLAHKFRKILGMIFDLR